MLFSMFGVAGLSSHVPHVQAIAGWMTVVPLLLAVWFLPNSHQLLARFQPTLEYVERTEERIKSVPPWARRFFWQPRVAWALIVATLTVFSILGLSRVSEFIYWQF
jgi:hypothetical protein